MSEEDLSGHFHTYPKTYDRNVQNLSPREFTRENFWENGAKWSVSYIVN